MRNQLTILILILASITTIKAQPLRMVSIGIEGGFNVGWCDDADLSNIRKSGIIDDCGVDWDDDASVTNMYVGVKPEFFITNQLSVDAGVRFTYTYSEYDKHYSRYMYWLYSQEGQNTSYIRVRNIEQESYWVGIPVDIRFVPRGLDETSVYLKAGCALNWRITTHNEVKCYKHDMKHYEDDIADQVSKPDNFALPIWLGVGMQFGPHKAMCIEFTFPYITEWAQTTSLGEVEPISLGFQFTYRLPTFISND